MIQRKRLIKVADSILSLKTRTLINYMGDERNQEYKLRNEE